MAYVVAVVAVIVIMVNNFTDQVIYLVCSASNNKIGPPNLS
jgi:hypothetical protein